MAKKYKRQANRSVPAAAGLASRSEFNPDYSAVRKDLKRIAALAGFFIVVLVGLSFFLQ